MAQLSFRCLATQSERTPGTTDLQKQADHWPRSNQKVFCRSPQEQTASHL